MDKISKRSKGTISAVSIGSLVALNLTAYGMTQNSASLMQVDRYSTVQEAASPAQLDPLLSIIQCYFPQEIKTIGDAVNYVLRYSGYQLATKAALSAPLITILSKPLPLVDRQIGPMSIQETLRVLVGKNIFTLVSDPINRQVNFKLNTSIKNKR